MPGQFLIHEAVVAGAATHALVIGVGAYPPLNGGAKKRTRSGLSAAPSVPLPHHE
jgi:hypothetical protein